MNGMTGSGYNDSGPQMRTAAIKKTVNEKELLFYFTLFPTRSYQSSPLRIYN